MSELLDEIEDLADRILAGEEIMPEDIYGSVFWRIYDADAIDSFVQGSDLSEDRISNIAGALLFEQIMTRPDVPGLVKPHIIGFILASMRIGWELCEESLLQTMDVDIDTDDE